MPEGYLLHIAKMAWQLEDGRHVTDSYDVVKDRKMVVVTQCLDDYYAIVVFPKPEHFPVLKQVAEAARFQIALGSHVENNPEALGSALIYESEFELCVHYLQAHFRTGNNRFLLSRKLAHFYGGWRIRAIKEIIKLGKVKKKPIFFSVQEKRPGRSESELNRSLVNDLELASNQEKVRYELSGNQFVISPT